MFRPTSFTRPFSRLSSSPRFIPSLTTSRHFSPSALRPFPRKDSQSKDSIDPTPTEYSKSSTDSQAAQENDAAFNPDQTDPGDEKNTAGEGHGEGGNEQGANPLDVSPANPEVSKARGGEEGGAENSGKRDGEGGRAKASGGGRGAKHGKTGGR